MPGPCPKLGLVAAKNSPIAPKNHLAFAVQFTNPPSPSPYRVHLLAQKRAANVLRGMCFILTCRCRPLTACGSRALLMFNVQNGRLDAGASLAAIRAPPRAVMKVNEVKMVGRESGVNGDGVREPRTRLREGGHESSVYSKVRRRAG